MPVPVDVNLQARQLLVPEAELFYKNVGGAREDITVLSNRRFAKGCVQRVRRVELRKSNHGLFEILAKLGVEQGAFGALLVRVAARDVPPAVRVLVLELKLAERDDGVLVGASTERCALQLAILDVDTIVILWVLVIRHH